MDRRKAILISVLVGIPVLFILFVLAITNVLLLFLGIILILCGAIVLKNKKPELFTKKQSETPRSPLEASPTDKDDDHRRANVYMVLNGSEDYGARCIAINKKYYTIGRSLDNDYVIDGRKISRHHIKIEYNEVEEICYAIDNGSVNGTSLNSERMIEGQRYRLEPGDILMIDDRTFVVEYAHY